MKRIGPLLALLAAACAATGAPQDGRRLVWGDEFDGTSLDLSKWRFRATMNSLDCTYSNDTRTDGPNGVCTEKTEDMETRRMIWSLLFAQKISIPFAKEGI